MGIADNFKGHSIDKPPKLNYANTCISVFKNRQILMPWICVLQYCVFGPFYSGKGIYKHVVVDETFTEIFHWYTFS